MPEANSESNPDPTGHCRLSAVLIIESARLDTVITSLRAIEAPTRVLPGCRQWGLYQRQQAGAEGAADDELLLITEWSSRAALETHVRSPEFRVVLAAIDLCRHKPEVTVETIRVSEGLRFLQSVLAKT